MTDRPAERVLAAIRAETWLIQPEALERIALIAERLHEPEAISRLTDGGDTGEPVSMVGSTAVLRIEGPMFRYANLFTRMSGATSTESVAAAFARLDASTDVERIVLNIDSPGGAASGISELAEMVASASTPVVAYAGGMMASAAYWIGAMADYVYANPTALVGSVGVRTIAPPKPGAEDVISRHAPNKAGSRAEAQRIVDRLEDHFHAAVAEGRGVTVEHVREQFGGGAVFVGTDAIERGLIDATATLDQVLTGTVGQPPARPRRAHRQPERSMSQQQEKGGADGAEKAYSAADVAAAREDGRKAGEAGASEQAVAAERERVAAVMKAGEGKPAANVQFAIKNGLTAEAAAEMFATVPDEQPPAATGSGLDAAMRARGEPRVLPEAGKRDDNEDEGAAATSAYLAGADAAVKEMS